MRQDCQSYRQRARLLRILNGPQRPAQEGGQVVVETMRRARSLRRFVVRGLFVAMLLGRRRFLMLMRRATGRMMRPPSAMRAVIAMLFHVQPRLR